MHELDILIGGHLVIVKEESRQGKQQKFLGFVLIVYFSSKLLFFICWTTVIDFLCPYVVDVTGVSFQQVFFLLFLI